MHRPHLQTAASTAPPRLSPQQLRSGLGRVCVAFSGEGMFAAAAESARETPLLEFRLDTLSRPQRGVEQMAAFLTEHPLSTVVATCRRQANGGRFSGTAKEELKLLTAAAAAGAHLVDLSIESAEELGEAALPQLAPALVILSWHDFKRTPALDPVLERILRFAPAVAKIVPTARALADNIAVFDLLEEHAADVNLVAMAMGQPGIPSRILGPRFGSLFTFAAPNGGEPTAPGQLPARTLTELYRIAGIDTATRVFGVAGKPVTGSLSPLMQNIAFRRETVNAVYMALETESVDDLLRLVDRVPLDGLSITMPLKQSILPRLDNSDPLSAKIGACNTVVRRERRLFGFNTDVPGILVPLERRIALAGCKVLVLGAGGAARAAVFALAARGAEVAILNRTPQTAQKLARDSGTRVQRRDQLGSSRFDVIINATSYGMRGTTGEPPLPLDQLRCRIFFDLVYNPLETPLLAAARARGIEVISGMEMFVQQGARQFEIWTGKPAPQDEMTRVVAHALRQDTPAAPAKVPVPAASDNLPVPAPAPGAKPVAAPAAKPAAAAKNLPEAVKTALEPANTAPTRPAAAPKPAAAHKPGPKPGSTKAAAKPAAKPAPARAAVKPPAQPAKKSAAKPPGKAPAKSAAKLPAKPRAAAATTKSRKSTFPAKSPAKASSAKAKPRSR